VGSDCVVTGWYDGAVSCSTTVIALPRSPTFTVYSGPVSPGMSTPSARHCQVPVTALTIVPNVAVCPCSTAPTRAAPVMLGAAVRGMVPVDTVTAAEAVVVDLTPGAATVTVAPRDLPSRAAAGTKEALSSVFATGIPSAVHRILVRVGVGLQAPRSSVTAPPTATSPPITGFPTVVKSWVGGVKSTSTTAPLESAETTWM